MKTKRTSITFIMFVFFAVFVATMCINSCSAVTYAYSDEAQEIYYCGGTDYTVATESFSYTTKEVEEYSINGSFPNYYSLNGELQNSCANAAGATIVGYFDRYYPDLIPDYTPGRIRSSKYIYYPMSYYPDLKQVIIEDLYSRMLTNIGREGTTQKNYKTGLSSYISSKGLSITYNSVMTNGAFDLGKAKVQFANESPISLFLSGYNFSVFTDENNQISIQKRLYNSTHVAVAYGYVKTRYFNENGSLIKEITYLKVATILNEVTGVYILNTYGNLDDAESAHIG